MSAPATTASPLGGFLTTLGATLVVVVVLASLFRISMAQPFHGISPKALHPASAGPSLPDQPVARP